MYHHFLSQLPFCHFQLFHYYKLYYDGHIYNSIFLNIQDSFLRKKSQFAESCHQRIYRLHKAFLEGHWIIF